MYPAVHTMVSPQPAGPRRLSSAHRPIHSEGLSHPALQPRSPFKLEENAQFLRPPRLPLGLSWRPWLASRYHPRDSALGSVFPGVAATSPRSTFWLVHTTENFLQAADTTCPLMQGDTLGIAGCICCGLGDAKPVRTRAVSVRAWASTV